VQVYGLCDKKREEAALNWMQIATMKNAQRALLPYVVIPSFQFLLRISSTVTLSQLQRKAKKKRVASFIDAK